MIGERKKILPESAVRLTRYTCRDEQGNARLLPQANLMDVVEHLCRIEEKQFGVLVRGRDEGQQRGAEGGRIRWLK